MKKFFSVAAFVFGIFFVNLMTAEALPEVFSRGNEGKYDIRLLFQCNYCNATVETNGTYPDDLGLAYGCKKDPGGRHQWACIDMYDGSLTPEERAAKAAEERQKALENAERAKKERAEREERIKAEIKRRIQLREQATETVNQADALFKSKDYATSTLTYAQAIEIDPYNGYTHYMLAKSLYRDETNKNKDFDLIIGEIQNAMMCAQNREELADYYDYLAKVYLHLAGKYLFDFDKNKPNYSSLSNQCRTKARQLRQQNNGQNSNLLEVLGGVFK